MKKVLCSPVLFVATLCSGLASPLLAQVPAQTPPLGIIVQSVYGSVGNAEATVGTSVYSGDSLSTRDDGSLKVRVGLLTVTLESSSSLHIYAAPYGAVVELNHGSVVYMTPGEKENLVIVADDVRVTPDASLPELGRVSIEDLCEVKVYSQRGQADVRVGNESRLVEEGKAYSVRAENRISYREYLSPEDPNYHRHHEHEPCAPLYMTRGRLPLPIGAGNSHFGLAAATLIGAGAGIAAWKALESPDRP